MGPKRGHCFIKGVRKTQDIRLRVLQNKDILYVVRKTAHFQRNKGANMCIG